MTDGTTNASLRRGDDVESITIERAAELLAERRAAGPSTRRRRAGQEGAPKKAAAKKAGPAKKAAAEEGDGQAGPGRRRRRRARRPAEPSAARDGARADAPRGDDAAVTSPGGAGSSPSRGSTAAASRPRPAGWPRRWAPTSRYEPGATAARPRAPPAAARHPTAAPVPRAEALLMAADRAQHVDEVVGPALAAGRWVVTDRFSRVDPRLPGRRAAGSARRAVAPVVDWATGGVAADLSILVDVAARAWPGRRLAAAARPPRAPGRRLPRAGPPRLLAAWRPADPAHWVVVDGTPADRGGGRGGRGRGRRARLGWPDVTGT